MQNNFFTGRKQLYQNSNNYEGNTTIISIGETKVECSVNITIGYNNYQEMGKDELKPLFRKVI